MDENKELVPIKIGRNQTYNLQGRGWDTLQPNQVRGNWRIEIWLDDVMLKSQRITVH